MLVARLKLHAGKVDAPAVDARRRAGLEAAQPQAHLPQAVGQTDGGLHPVRAGGNGAVTDDDTRIEIGARGDHHGAHAVDRAEARRYGADRAALVEADLRDHGLHQLKALLPLQRVLHVLLVFPAVGLRAQRVDGGAFAAVEHPVLDAAAVGGLRHLAAQRVQLAHQMALARAADGRVAGHISHGVEVDREHRRVQSEPCAGKARLDPGVTGPDDDRVKASGFKFHGDPSRGFVRMLAGAFRRALL